jgi:hypothetical protein
VKVSRLETGVFNLICIEMRILKQKLVAGIFFTIILLSEGIPVIKEIMARSISNGPQKVKASLVKEDKSHSSIIRLTLLITCRNMPSYERESEKTIHREYALSVDLAAIKFVINNVIVCGKLTFSPEVFVVLR